MIEFHGIYLDGRSSRLYPAILTCDGRVLRIRVKEESIDRSVSLADCRIDPPLGKTTPAIRLPDGAVCETEDTKAFAELYAISGRNRGMRFVHFIESRWKLVGLSFMGIVLFVWLFKIYAIPYLAKEIAFSTPASISEELSRQTMKILDKQFLRPSTLGSKRITELRSIFSELVKDTGPGDFDYRLEFRKSPFTGPNAFALPSGQIVMTDELVKLSENNRELEGILVHEIGHVKERHGLRMAIQNTGVFVIIAVLLGDLAEISSTAASLPTILAQSDYSREFERAADRFAVLYFVQKQWDITPMQDILKRISKDMPNFPGESILSTHPVMQERIRYLEMESQKRRDTAFDTNAQ